MNPTPVRVFSTRPYDRQLVAQENIKSNAPVSVASIHIPAGRAILQISIDDCNPMGSERTGSVWLERLDRFGKGSVKVVDSEQDKTTSVHVDLEDGEHVLAARNVAGLSARLVSSDF
jgi:hypothetical protein